MRWVCFRWLLGLAVRTVKIAREARGRFHGREGHGSGWNVTVVTSSLPIVPGWCTYPPLAYTADSSLVSRGRASGSRGCRSHRIKSHHMCDLLGWSRAFGGWRGLGRRGAGSARSWKEMIDRNDTVHSHRYVRHTHPPFLFPSCFECISIL